MQNFSNASLKMPVGSGLPAATIASNTSNWQAVPPQILTPIPFGSERKRVLPMNRKRRTVLWLYNEDYEYLRAVAEHDMDTKNVSMHRLVKALRAAGIKSFLKLEEGIRRLPQSPGR